MSYLVLARKYRPQVFDDIVGQDHLIKTLSNAISGGRVAHAYLFCGPRGVGKTTAARILAKALNCETGPTPVPCNTCSSCMEITDGRSMDVLEIDGASNRGINEVRELRENVRYAASGGRSKVYIIDEVHMLTTEAFNALLKTLEEPPAHVVFVFATTEPFKVPPTILSRVQRFDFARISGRAIADHLARLMKEENIQASPEALALVARRAKGGLRDALSLMDQIISAAEGAIERETVEQFLGLMGIEFYDALVDRFAEEDAGGALELLEKTYSQGADLGDVAEGLVTHLRDLMLLSLGGDLGSLVETPESDLPRLQEQAKRFSRDAVIQLVDQAADIAATLRRSEHPRLQLELGLAEMSQVAGRASLGELTERLLRLEQALGAGGATAAPRAKGSPRPAPTAPPTRKPAPPPAPAPAKRSPPVSDAPTGLEATFLEMLRDKSMGLWGMLQTAESVSFRSEGTLVLKPSNPVTAERIAEAECRETLMAVLRDMGVKNPKIQIGDDPAPAATEAADPAGSKSPRAAKAKPEAKTEDPDTRTMGQVFKDEPMLQKALDMFDGEVLP